MIPVPIIIPITNTSVRDCIIEAGKEYCESSPADPKMIGIVLLCLVVFGLWSALMMWVSDKFFNESIGFIMATVFGLPLLVIGLVLIIS